MFEPTGIAPQDIQKLTADPAATGGTGLPQYSWGYDPTTQSWGYFMNKAGSQSMDIGRKAGDKQISYAAPKNDAASMQQQALQHLLNTQVTANAPAAPTTAQAPQTNVAGSGIGAAAGNQSSHGGGASGVDGGMSRDNGTYGEGSGLGGVAAGLGNFAQMIGPDTKIGKVLMGISDGIARNNNPNYSNEGLHSGTDPNASGTNGQMGNPYGPTTPDAAGAGPASPMGTDPATAAANAAAANPYAGFTSNDFSGYSSGNDSMGPPSSAANASDGNGAGVGAGPASPMGGDPASREGGHGGTGGGGSGGDGGGGGAATGGNGGDASGGGDRGTRGGFSTGGEVAGLHAAASLPPRMVRGEGDGQSDSIPVKMDDGGDGRLADNEFVVPADAVSALGSGSSEAGARALYAMVDRIRQTAHGTKQQAKPVDPRKVLAA